MKATAAIAFLSLAAGAMGQVPSDFKALPQSTTGSVSQAAPAKPSAVFNANQANPQAASDKPAQTVAPTPAPISAPAPTSSATASCAMKDASSLRVSMP